VQEANADRQARFEQIQELTRLLQEANDDRQARFEQIQELTWLLQVATHAPSQDGGPSEPPELGRARLQVKDCETSGRELRRLETGPLEDGGVEVANPEAS
jgi:hypothetical protein